MPPTVGELGPVVVDSFAKHRLWPPRCASSQSVQLNSRSIRSALSMFRDEDETAAFAESARAKNQMCDQTYIDYKSGMTNTDFRRSFLPRWNAAGCAQTRRSRPLTIPECGKRHSDLESVLESAGEDPREYRNSRAGRFSVLTKCVACPCFDD